MFSSELDELYEGILWLSKEGSNNEAIILLEIYGLNQFFETQGRVFPIYHSTSGL